jgi:hypothetical protein
MATAVRNVTSHVRVIERITHPPRELSQQKRPVAATIFTTLSTAAAVPLDTPREAMAPACKPSWPQPKSLRGRYARVMGNVRTSVLSEVRHWHAATEPCHRFPPAGLGPLSPSTATRACVGATQIVWRSCGDLPPCDVHETALGATCGLCLLLCGVELDVTGSAPASAQRPRAAACGPVVSVFATGLNNPRGLTDFEPDGTWVEKVLGLAFRGDKLYALEMSTSAGGPTRAPGRSSA